MNNDAYFYILVTILICIAGFVIRKNRLFFILQAMWLVILTGFNTYSMDWGSNEQPFLAASLNGNKNLYNYIAVLFKNMGFSYISFNFTLCLISTVLICYVILKLSKNPCIVLSYIYIYPMIDNIIQKRTYYALGFIVLAYYLFYKINNMTMKIIAFIICVFLSLQFHTVGLIAISYLIYKILPDKLKNIFVVCMALGGLILRNQFMAFVNRFGNQELEEKGNLYFNVLAQNSSIAHFLFWLIWQLAFIVLIFYLIRKLNINSDYSKYLMELNIWSLVILPLYTFDPVFARFFRVIMIFNFIFISNIFVVNKSRVSKYALGGVLMQILLSTVSLYVFVLNSPFGFEEMVLWIFQNNAVLK